MTSTMVQIALNAVSDGSGTYTIDLRRQPHFVNPVTATYQNVNYLGVAPSSCNILTASAGSGNSATVAGDVLTITQATPASFGTIVAFTAELFF